MLVLFIFTCYSNTLSDPYARIKGCMHILYREESDFNYQSRYFSRAVVKMFDKKLKIKEYDL